MSETTVFDRPFIAYDGSETCKNIIPIFAKHH